MKPRRFSRVAFPLASAISALLAAPAALAVNYYWDNNGTTLDLSTGLGTSGTWNGATNASNTYAVIPNGLLNGTAGLVSGGTATTTSDSIYFGTNNLALGATASTIATTGTISINNIVFGTGQGAQGVTLGSGGTITLGGTTPTVTSNNTGTNIIGAVLAGTAMTTGGSGTLTLTNASNTLSGTVTVTGGGRLNLGNGTSGGFTATTNALTFNGGGGTFNLAKADTGSQTMGALSFSAGDGAVISTAASGSATQTLTFGSFSARTAGATGNFSLATNTTAAQNKITLTNSANAPVNGSGSNNQGLFFGGTEYTRYDTDLGYFRAVTYGTDSNASALVSGTDIGVTTSATDIKLNGNITAQATASVNTLNLAANNFTFDNAAQILSVNGILSAGSASASIANGTNASSIQTTASGGELVIRVNGASDALTIAPNIVANGASSLTKSGAGLLTLSGTNTYTGTTTVNSGTLTLSGGAAIVDTGAVVMANSPGATLLLNNSETIGQISGGGFSGGNVNVGANTLTIANANNQAFGGTFSGTGAGGVTISSGTLTLSNKNSFAGTITLAGSSQLTMTYGNDGTANPAPLSSGGTISMAGGTFLNFSPTANVAGGVAQILMSNATNGWAVGNAINITSGTATIQTTGASGLNDIKWNFSGGVTGGTSGSQTLAINQGGFGTPNQGDRQALLFSGIIANGSGGTLGVSADFRSTSGVTQSAYVSLREKNTFTGPITVSNTKGMIPLFASGSNVQGGFLVIGGERINNGAPNSSSIVVGSGALGWNGTIGNYTNTISLANGTFLDYASSVNQTLGGVISGDGGVIIEGTGVGTLTLSNASNTYGGGTFIAAGTLIASSNGNLGVGSINFVGGTLQANGNIVSPSTRGVGMTGAGTVNTNGNSVSIAGTIAGTGNLTKSGTGTLTLSGANFFTGTTTVSGGTLALTNALALQNSALVTTSGTSTIGSFSALTIGGLSGASGNLGSANVLFGYTGNVAALTLNPQSGTVTYGGVISDGFGNMTLTKTGAGTQTLSGANTYTGATTVSAGTLTLDYGTQNNSKLSDSAALIFDGGTVTLAGGSHTEVVASTTLQAGKASSITRSSGTSVLQLGTITVNPNASLNLGAANIATTNNLNNASGYLGTWATIGGADWAINSTNAANGSITAFSAYTDLTRLSSGTKIIPNTSTANIRIIEGTGSAANITLAAATTSINTLVNSTSGGSTAATIDFASQTLRTNAILQSTSAGLLTVGVAGGTAGTLTAATPGGDLAVQAYSTNGLTINSVIADNTSASTLTKYGTGTLTLAGANTYSGGTILNGGLLNISANNNLGAATTGITVNGSSQITSTVGAVDYTRAITLNSGATLTLRNAGVANSTVTFSGAITGTGGIANVNGLGGTANTIALSNPNNTFTGNLTLSQAAGNNDFVSFASIGDGGLINIGKGSWRGVAQYTGAAGVIFNNRQISLTSSFANVVDGNGNPINAFENNGTGTVTFNTDMLVATGNTGTFAFGGTNTGNNTFAGDIPNSAGGTLSIWKHGTGTWSLTGTNTYAGTTTVSGGVLALSTLANGGSSGSIGISSNAAGNLILNGGTLRYTGAAVTSDRLFSLQSSSSMDSSGSGALNLNNTGIMGFNGGIAAKVLTLTGNNTGNNTLAAAIGNNIGATTVTKSGVGTWILTNAASNYTGGTNVNGGTLMLSGAVNLPTTGTLAVAAGGNFSLADGTVRNTTAATLTLASGSLLSFDWSSDGTVDNLAPTAAITPAAGAAVGIIINPIGTPTGGGDLLTGITGSTLNNPNYFLANNTNFTATITKPGAGAGSVSIGSYAAVGALTNAYWKRNQVTGATDTMAFSSGTASNWASDAAGTSAGGVVPGGSGVNVIFGSSTPGSTAVTVGADMNLGSITFNDTVSYTISGNSLITLNSNSGTAATTSGANATVTAGSAISVTSFANASNAISANLALGANQTWNVASGKSLTVSGIVSGGSSLTKADAGLLTLTGANSYSGGTTISAGVLAVGQNNGGVGGDSISPDGTSTSLGSGAVSVAAGAALHINTAGLTIANDITLNGLSYGVNSGGPAATNTGFWNGALMGVSKTGVVSNTFTGTITMNATSNVSTNWNDKTMVFTGKVTGAGGLVIDNSAPTVRRGSLVQLGNSTNDYSGDTTINNGNTAGAQPTLILGASNVIPDGALKGNLVVLGNLNLNGFSDTVNGLSGSGVINNGVAATTSTLIVGNNDATGLNYSGSIQNGSGTVALTKIGAGNQTLSGANTYTGNTTVSAGTLTFSGSGAISSTANVSIASGAQIVASATTNNVLGFAAGRSWNISGTLNSSGGGAQTMPGTINLNNGTMTGVANATFGTFLTNAAYTTTITANGASNLIGSANFGMSNLSTLAINTPLLADALSVTAQLGLAGQTGALTKSGLGTVTLSGINNYTGATNVNAGKLLINGSTSTSSAVSVNSGGTLGGNGTIGGSVTVQANGTFAPGNSIDSIASGNLTLLASSTFAHEVNKFADLGVSGDLTVVTGSLSITALANLTLTELGTSGAWDAGDKITLIGYSTGTWNGGLFTYLGNTLEDDSTFNFSGTDWTFNYDDTAPGDNYQSDMAAFTGSARYVTMTAAIPEPSSLALLGLGSLLILRRRR